jgi:hypothetical protein
MPIRPFLQGLATLLILILSLVYQGFSQVYKPELPIDGRPPIDYRQLDRRVYEEGVIRVKFAEGPEKSWQEPVLLVSEGTVETGLEGFDRVSKSHGILEGASVLQSFYSLVPQKSSLPALQERHRSFGLHRWYEFRVDAGQDIPSLLEELMSLPEVEIAEPVFRIERLELVEGDEGMTVSPAKSEGLGDLSNDPRLPDQWSFYNFGQNGGTPGTDIGLSGAWQAVRGNPEVIVAVIDGGIYVDHPDLKGNLWQDAGGHAGYNFANDTTALYPGNHATHVAGTIAAVSNNGMGVSGIAGGSGQGDGVRIMNLQVFGQSRTAGFHLAPVWAADNGAAISQNSWGYSAPGVYDQLVLDAIDYFNAYGGGDMLQGGITIFAAGNRGKDEEIYPACYSGTVAVASTNSRDIKANNSSYGAWVDLSAPGVGIVSTIGHDGYGSSSGTSMASPHVAGVAALLVSRAPGMLSAEEVIDIIRQTTDDHYGSNPGFEGLLGTGRLNAGAAIRELHRRLGMDEPAGEEAQPEFYFLSDGDWENPDNWYLDPASKQTAGELPAENSQVHIMAKARTSGTIWISGQGSLTIHDQAELSAMDIDMTDHEGPGSPITIHPTGRLQAGLLHGGPDTAPLRILSSDQGSGSLLHEGGNMRLEAEHLLRGPAGSWQMLASPAMGQPIGTSFDIKSFYGWHEPGQSWVSPSDPLDLPAWLEANAGSSDLLPGKGYMLAQQEVGDATATFRGLINAGQVALTLSGKADGQEAFSGFNLVGNPYPSAIDWNAEEGWGGRNHLKTTGAWEAYSIWVWDPESGNYGAYNTALGSDTGTHGTGRYLQPHQAFWVRAAADGEVLTVDNRARLHAGQPAASGNETNSSFLLTVSSHDSPYRDQVLMGFCGEGPGGGTEKMYSLYADAPSLYIPMQEADYSIRLLPVADAGHSLPLSFIAGHDGQHVITAEGTELLEGDVLLLDRQTGLQHNLSREPEYPFAAAAGDDPDRFLITFGVEQTTNIMAVESTKPGIWVSQGMLHVTNPWQEEMTVQVYNTTGAAVSGTVTAPGSQLRSSLNLSQGVYIVRVSSAGRVHSEKILVGQS